MSLSLLEKPNKFVIAIQNKQEKIHAKSGYTESLKERRKNNKNKWQEITGNWKINGKKKTLHGAKNVQHGSKNVWHGAKNVWHGADNVQHGAKKVRL